MKVRYVLLAAIIAAAVAVTAYMLMPKAPLTPETLTHGVPRSITLHSPTFSVGSVIPSKYTCEGIDINPHITWEDVPEGAKSLVLIMYDPDAPKGIFYHWLLYSIPPTVDSIPEGLPKTDKLSIGLQGRNDFGTIGYGGPCPPPGETHRYVIIVYALDYNPELPAGMGPQELLNAMDKHVIAYGVIEATYSRD